MVATPVRVAIGESICLNQVHAAHSSRACLAVPRSPLLRSRQLRSATAPTDCQLGSSAAQVSRFRSSVSVAGILVPSKNKNEAIKIMHAAIDEGMTFFDNAWDYHDGGSEEIMGRALSEGGKRDKVFLMTKNCERDYEGSKRGLDESLKRLKTDHLDLWQFHEMVYDSDPDWVFEKGGLKAALEAQKAGKVRYIGFTGHKDPRIHIKMLNKPYDWASAQMPINVMDAHYRSFQKEVVPVCLSKDVGVIGMKSLGGGAPKGRIPSETDITHEQCRRYALSLPVSTLVVGLLSMDELKAEIAIGRNFKPMTDAQRATVVAQAAAEGGDGRHETF